MGKYVWKCMGDTSTWGNVWYRNVVTVPVCDLEKQYIRGTQWVISIAMVNDWRVKMLKGLL